ncbi:hypothetical protein [Acetivibrio ethanolgignens]|uniref:Uncharacterized protein n=1 Tax=Acetivibrio ethanolgignens TaxID=290052 RepID=A0A0V8QCI9_9FIRM|nr:hypothetical protein [Acetivibrio ethanolgignens]KSV58261.1 hypothetical protein ASU35_13440 [Acetivibrio ethanolgignens]
MQDKYDRLLTFNSTNDNTTLKKVWQDLNCETIKISVLDPKEKEMCERVIRKIGKQVWIAVTIAEYAELKHKLVTELNLVKTYVLPDVIVWKGDNYTFEEQDNTTLVYKGNRITTLYSKAVMAVIENEPGFRVGDVVENEFKDKFVVNGISCMESPFYDYCCTITLQPVKLDCTGTVVPKGSISYEMLSEPEQLLQFTGNRVQEGVN